MTRIKLALWISHMETLATHASANRLLWCIFTLIAIVLNYLHYNIWVYFAAFLPCLWLAVQAINLILKQTKKLYPRSHKKI
jgi:hypothetical protein